MSVTTFRDSIRKMSPPWLQGFWGERYLYAIGLHLDAFGDSLAAALKLRFPNLYSNETLALLGRERGILRGFDETDDEAYATRLRAWWDTHRRRGNPYALMDVLAGYLTGHAVKMRIVNNAGAWYTRNTDGSREYHLSDVAGDWRNWKWDASYTALVSRFWVILYPLADLWVRDGTWGDGSTWGGDLVAGTWGSSAPLEQVTTLRNLIATWQAAHARCSNIIVSFDLAAFAPTDTRPTLPDGLWGNASANVGGIQVPTRDSRAIYWEGTP